MDFHYYCPICGATQFRMNVVCIRCHNQVEMLRANFRYQYYQEKSMEKYGDLTHWYEFLLPEIEENPLYNPDAISNKPNSNITNNPTFSIGEGNIPKCPTCGSTNIKKISLTSKAIGAAMFGLFSKNATSQFKCDNCGYKW